MTEAELSGLVLKLQRKQARDTINRLLAGNDTQCFTTEQYVTAYVKAHWKKDEGGGRAVLGWFKSGGKGETIAHWHLRTSGMVHEVKPDVWTILNTTEAQHGRPTP